MKIPILRNGKNYGSMNVMLISSKFLEWTGNKLVTRTYEKSITSYVGIKLTCFS